MSKDTIDKMLQSSQPTLTEAERSRIWNEVASELNLQVETASPYMEFLKTYIMNPFVIAFMCIIGITSTAAAIDNAKPGDVLFLFEQFTDEVRLTIASTNRKNELRTSFATERFAELQAILDEESITENESKTLALASSKASVTSLVESVADDVTNATGLSIMSKNSTLSPILSLVAKVYADITIVTITEDGFVTRFITKANTQDALTVEIATLQGLDVATVEAVLVIETQNGVSRPSDRGDVISTSKGEARVVKAVDALINQLDGIDDNVIRGQFIAKLLHEVNGVKVSRGSSEVDDVQDNRIRIENKHVMVGEDGNYLYLSDDNDENIVDDEIDATRELRVEEEGNVNEALPNQSDVKDKSQSGNNNKNEEDKSEPGNKD